MVKFAVESVGAVRGEIEPLLQAHYEEIAANRDVISLDVDWGKYEAMERDSALRVFTARDEGILCGYSVFFLFWHMHYKSTLFAQNDVLFLSKEARKGRAGSRLIEFSEERLKEDGVVKLTWHIKADNDWSPILKRKKYLKAEIIMSKVL